MSRLAFSVALPYRSKFIAALRGFSATVQLLMFMLGSMKLYSKLFNVRCVEFCVPVSRDTTETNGTTNNTNGINGTDVTEYEAKDTNTSFTVPFYVYVAIAASVVVVVLIGLIWLCKKRRLGSGNQHYVFCHDVFAVTQDH